MLHSGEGNLLWQTLIQKYCSDATLWWGKPYSDRLSCKVLQWCYTLVRETYSDRLSCKVLQWCYTLVRETLLWQTLLQSIAVMLHSGEGNLTLKDSTTKHCSDATLWWGNLTLTDSTTKYCSDATLWQGKAPSSILIWNTSLLSQS